MIAFEMPVSSSIERKMKPFAAGVWDAWKDGQRHWLQSFAIVTTEANEMMARIHPLMPPSCTRADIQSPSDLLTRSKARHKEPTAGIKSR
ncbi:MAG: SOS response-associated peptidase family protein [Acidobacteriaceae bacterium]